MHAYARSISTLWLVNTPLSALGLILVLFIRAYSLRRTTVRKDAEKTNGPDEAETMETASGETGIPIKDNATELMSPSLGGETTQEGTQAES